MNVIQSYVNKIMIGVIKTEDREVGFFDILNARSYELECVKGPSVRIGGGISASSHRHDVVLMVYVVVFEFDCIWIDDFLLIDDDTLAVLVVVEKADRVVKLVAVRNYSVGMHWSERW